MQKQNYYAANEINIEGGPSFKRGELVATLEYADGVPLDNVVRAIGSGIVVGDKPAPTPSKNPAALTGPNTGKTGG